MVRRSWKEIAWLGFWGTGLHNAFGYVGLHYTTATNGVMLNSAIPILIIVLGWAIYRERITQLQAFGVFVSLAGVLTIVTRGSNSTVIRAVAGAISFSVWSHIPAIE